MGKVACIYFEQSNIILVKDNLKRTKVKNIFLYEEQMLGNIYYNIVIRMPEWLMTERIWDKLENYLLDIGVDYIVWCAPFEVPEFKTLIYVTGEFVQRLLSYHILQYVGKYQLVKKAPMYMRIGVVAGRLNDTLDVIIPLLEDVTSLTIITEVPAMYREVAAEIYESHKLKVKVVPPQKGTMGNLDIIYDISGNAQYMNKCHPKSIYVDLKGNLNLKNLKYEGILPSIWKGFDILCEGYQVPIPLMEAFWYSEGFSKRILRKKVRDLDITISRVYPLVKLTMSV
ncbi:MAG: hypothetical protein ACRCW2_07300 [Cellulosilyticaceae bacterium]